MTRVNLLPDTYVELRRRADSRRTQAGVALCAVAAGAVWFGAAFSQVRTVSSEATTVEKEVATARARAVAAAEDRQRQMRVLDLVERGSQLEVPLPATALVALLVRNMPDSLAVERLTILSGTPEPAPGAASPTGRTGPRAAARRRGDIRVEIDGVALSDVDVAQLVSALSKEACLGNVKLARSRHMTVAGLPRFGFQISLEVWAPPARAKGDDAGRTTRHAG